MRTLPSIKTSDLEEIVLAGTVEHDTLSVDSIQSSEISPSSQIRVTRAVNEALTKTGTIDDDILVFKNFGDAMDQNDLELSGRSVNLIQPTKTYKDGGKMKKVIATGVEIGPLSGEGQGAPQARALLEPQEVKPTAVMTHSFVTFSPESIKGRQASPDIQDIITGIVKLLNGNVNVQANTAPAMGRPLRPISTRINNRGPPRITDVAPLPPDFDVAAPLAPPPLVQMNPPGITTKMPTPYPFERPPNTLPIKPYLNGIPLPEQLVPSAGSRPGIRRPVTIPPWKRPQRRPPPPGRRPPNGNIPPYKPIPSYSGESYAPDEPVTFSNNSQDIFTLNLGSDMQIIPITEEPQEEIEVHTEVENNDTIPAEGINTENISSTEIIPVVPEKEYLKDKEVSEKIEKKKDKEKNSLKMDKYNSKYIVSTTSEVNEKTKSVSTTATQEDIVESTIMSNSTAQQDDQVIQQPNNTELFNKLGEGIGEITPVLETSIQEISSSLMESTSTSSDTATDVLPSGTSTTISETSLETSSTSSTTTTTGNLKKILNL